MKNCRKAEALILGGGPAGAAAALTLARGGCKAILLERELRPAHKVCGEFLSHEALQILQSFSIRPQELGAVPIRAVRIAGTGSPSSASLPFPAFSLTRCALDEALLQRAEAEGATLWRGVPALRLERKDSEWEVTLADGSAIRTPTVFLACGKHDLHGWLRPPGRQRGLVAFKMYWRLEPKQAAELEGHVELLLYDNGYAGLQLVESGAANLCCLIEQRKLRRLGGRWEQLLLYMQESCPHLRRRLTHAQPLLERPLAIASLPYGFVRTTTAPQLWAVGDQAAVIPSFTGDGVSIALASGCLGAEMYLEGKSAEDFQVALQTIVRRQVALATFLSRALVWKNAQRLTVSASRLWPQALQVIASSTRFQQAMVRKIT